MIIAKESDKELLECKKIIIEERFTPQEIARFALQWEQRVMAHQILGKAFPELFPSIMVEDETPDQKLHRECTEVVISKFMEEMRMGYEEICLHTAIFIPAIDPSEAIENLMYDLHVTQEEFVDHLKEVLATAFYDRFAETPQGARILSRNTDIHAEVADRAWLWIADSLHNTPEI